MNYNHIILNNTTLRDYVPNIITKYAESLIDAADKLWRNVIFYDFK